MNPAHYNWVIELKEIGKVIGSISVVELNEKIAAAEIGYCIGKAWWGQAIMPEALKRIIVYLLVKRRTCAGKGTITASDL